MTKIEDELRTLYAEPAGVREVEASIVDAFTNRPSGRAPVTHESPRPPRTWRWPSSWAAAGVTAAVVAGIAVGVVTLTDRPQQTDSTTTGATATRAAGRPTSPVAPTSEPLASAPSDPTSTVTVTAQVVAQTLISLLPRTGAISKLSGSYSMGTASAEFVYDDGHGPAAVSALLQFPFEYQGTLRPQGSGPLCTTALMPTQHCTTRSDGSQFSTYQGDANIPGGATEWSVTELRADGVLIDVSAWNSASEKGAPQTRSEPPFTMKELARISVSPRWQTAVTAGAARRVSDLFTPERSGP